MGIDPTSFCNCYLTTYTEPKVIETDGRKRCSLCGKVPLPPDYCRCDPMWRLGAKDSIVDGAKVCGRCNLKLAWIPRHEEPAPEDDPNLVLTTIDYVPGYRITEVLGLVSQLVGSSGLTAGVKGREAKNGALRALSRSAYNLDANAVIGISFSAFGAGGGLTNVFGGDAVGVLVSGTAVRIEKIEEN